MRSYHDRTGKFAGQLRTCWQDYMIEHRLAVAYEGQSKDSIAAAHQANIDWLTDQGRLS